MGRKIIKEFTELKGGSCRLEFIIYYLPKNTMNARRCHDCEIIGGVLIEQCQDCENYGMSDEVYDSETEDFVVILPPPPKVNKRKQGLTPKDLEEKKRRVEAQASRRAEKIRKALELAAKKLAEKRKSELCMDKRALAALFPNEREEQEVLEKFVENVPKGRAIKLPVAAPEYSTRGPSNIPELKPYITYTKPINYFTIPLKIDEPAGDWIGSTGGKNEWIVAYHGTSVSAASSIIKSGFRPGPGQACRGSTNLNHISCAGPVGEGIYCSPYISTAEGYNKAIRYFCILQCRVNPTYLKVASAQNWVLNDPKYIRPYKLLVRLKVPPVYR